MGNFWTSGIPLIPPSDFGDTGRIVVVAYFDGTHHCSVAVAPQPHTNTYIIVGYKRSLVSQVDELLADIAASPIVRHYPVRGVSLSPEYDEKFPMWKVRNYRRFTVNRLKKIIRDDEGIAVLRGFGLNRDSTLREIVAYRDLRYALAVGIWCCASALRITS